LQTKLTDFFGSVIPVQPVNFTYPIKPSTEPLLHTANKKPIVEHSPVIPPAQVQSPVQLTLFYRYLAGVCAFVTVVCVSIIGI
jgi:hypothetical protein